MAFPKWAITVTPLSKTLAFIIFVTLPIIGFFLGMKYQQICTISSDNTSIISPIRIVPLQQKIIPTKTPSNVGIANPASVYCIKQGGENKIVTASDGSQSGQCIFPDGRVCDEWQFFRTNVCK